ncbi:MAG: L-rhamnose isomerase [Candidatus Doudnabacteria bacterium]|nr:L-rhamnose isomerase [Candidatus Doudnabacteria bacterium]
MNYKESYKIFSEDLHARGLNLELVKNRLKKQKIETPSWGYANSGTRFATFPYPGAARTLEEKIEDAAMVHKLTGIAPSVALHIPWDKTSDWEKTKTYAENLGVSIGAINPNLFQNETYKFGSLANSNEGIRKQAIEHVKECIEIMKKTGSKDLSLWLADGSNYAGQVNMQQRKLLLEESLNEIYNFLPEDKRLLIEYKFFEPAFYHTDLPDWGTAYAFSKKLGEKAKVLVDTGHHAPGTNIEQIVAFLLTENSLGGFHFNARKYADDDLIVGSVNPFELFLIFIELVIAENSTGISKTCADNISYMIDQSHNIEPKIEAMVQSIINCQTAFAKALLVDYKSLQEKQNTGDVLGAHRELTLAFETDVKPLLYTLREEMNLNPDPIKALHENDYQNKITAERGSDTNQSSGYPTA